MRITVVASLLVLFAGCSSPRARVGEACTTAADCESQLCRNLYSEDLQAGLACSAECTTSADCPAGLSCGTLVDGARVCLSACSEQTYWPPGFVCADGAYTACEHAGAAATCGACGCPAGEYCSMNEVCEPVLAVGEACYALEDCASGNCSQPFGIDPEQPGTCQVGRDQPCTSADCIACEPTVAGDRCAQSCDRASQCAADEVCIFTGEERIGSCRKACRIGLPCQDLWTCRATSDGEVTFCEPPKRCDPADELSCGVFASCDPTYRVCR